MKFALAEKCKGDEKGRGVFRLENWERRNEVELGVQVCGCSRMKVMEK